MDEMILTGYCRSTDSHRMVMVEKDGGKWYADCCYGNCPYEANCEIAKKIREQE